jgi:hypothetical protein
MNLILSIHLSYPSLTKRVSSEYMLDSFPVAICDNIRICQSRLVCSEDYRGYIASKKRFF